MAGELRLANPDPLVGIRTGVLDRRHYYVGYGNIPELACGERESGE